MAQYSIFDVANWFLCKEEMSHKKLQKLCYYAVAWGHTLLERPIAEPSEFQAWVHGPVSPTLYEKYKGNSWTELSPDDDFRNQFDPVVLDLLESVWLTYGNETGNALEVLSHSELPWTNARGNCGSSQRCEKPISVEDMRRYYQSIFTGGEA